MRNEKLKYLLVFIYIVLTMMVVRAYSATYIQGPALIEGTVSTATTGGTTTLTKDSETNQIFTGTATQTVKLPNATTIPVGRRFYIADRSTLGISIVDNGSNVLKSMISDTQARITLRDNSTANGVWDVEHIKVDLASSDVTGVLPVANGGTGASSFTLGSVIFMDGASLTQDNANFFWDATNHRLGLGNAAPSTRLDVTGSQNITSTSANALTVGPAGSTNPVFQIDSSTASVANGLKITGTAAGSGVKLESISTAANENIILGTKGPSSSVKLQVGASDKYVATAQNHTFSVSATGTASTVRFGYTGASDSNLTASTEAPSTYFNLGQTRQHATGAIALQRDFRITPSVHSFVGASTLTNAAAFSIDGPSNGSTNATITNSHALYIPPSALTNVTNSYGLSVNATSGATNNYAAQFIGGNVGIGTSAPSDKLHVASGEIMVSSNTSTSSAIHNGIKFTTDNETYYSAVRANRDTLSTKIGLSFLTANGGAPVETMRINYAGYVGIGTSSPTSLLHQDSGTATATAHKFTAGTTTGQTASDGFDVGISTTGVAELRQRENLSIIAYTNNSQRFQISAGGQVAIGSSAPTTSAALDIQGTTGAVLLPRLTSAQRNALTATAGMIIYNTDNTQVECYYAAWGPCTARSNSTQTSLTFLGTISISLEKDRQTILVATSSGAVALSPTPFGSSAPLDGTEITLIGNSDTNTPVIQTNDAAKGILGYQVTLGRGQTVTYVYNATLDRYVIKSTSN